MLFGLVKSTPKLLLSICIPLCYHPITAGIPYDGVPNNQTDVLHWGVVVPIYLMATAGTVFAVACLAFNFIFRNRKYVHITFYHAYM